MCLENKVIGLEYTERTLPHQKWFYGFVLYILGAITLKFSSRFLIRQNHDAELKHTVI